MSQVDCGVFVLDKLCNLSRLWDYVSEPNRSCHYEWLNESLINLKIHVNGDPGLYLTDYEMNTSFSISLSESL